MGYDAQWVTGDLRIPPTQVDEAIDTVEWLVKTRTAAQDARFFSSTGSYDIATCIATLRHRASTTINQWTLSFDSDGSLIADAFDGDHFDEDACKALLDALAPYVPARTVLGFVGEDCTVWAYVFNGTECREFSARIAPIGAEGFLTP